MKELIHFINFKHQEMFYQKIINICFEILEIMREK